MHSVNYLELQIYTEESLGFRNLCRKFHLCIPFIHKCFYVHTFAFFHCKHMHACIKLYCQTSDNFFLLNEIPGPKQHLTACPLLAVDELQYQDELQEPTGGKNSQKDILVDSYHWFWQSCDCTMQSNEDTLDMFTFHQSFMHTSLNI